MSYKNVYLLDDNDTTNFYNLDIIKDALPDCEVNTYISPQTFIKDYINHINTVEERVLLLLDINMPEKQGFEVIEFLEEELHNIDNLDIIMLSSSNLKIDREKATRYPNVFGFIEKPLTEEKLFNAINGVF